jgi:hypothetical protein
VPGALLGAWGPEQRHAMTLEFAQVILHTYDFMDAAGSTTQSAKWGQALKCNI